ncbi:uncharacterized protein LOC117222272 [Megalopta genalis]|uniref:uncharacterized protein LOC117222272 n=1 Tax=Megalopta genalis TaxID=115081 RepID=UPI003FD48878
MHFVITFGFLISTKFDVNIENENSVALNKKVTKKQQHKKKARGKNNHNNAEIKSNKHNNTEIKPNTVNIGKILAEAHVEYELLPGYTFKFDCRCWETATKIYTENADWCLRPIVHENNLWVVFSIHHEVDLNEVQLQKFFDYVITYQIFPGNNKFYDRAKKDKVKQFYTHANTINIKHNDFLEIYPSELEPITKSKPEPIIVKHETDGEFSIISYLDVIPDNRHQYKFWRMMKKEKFPSEPATIEFVPSTEVKVPLKSKKLKNMKTQEMTVQMSLTTRNLFSDMGTITCYTRKSQIPNILSIFIYTQCDNILSNNKLRRKFNNISIKLEKVSNIPNNIIIQKGFNYLYVKINFIDKIIITPYYIPTKTIYFDFMNCFMNNEFQAEELISFLGTKSLTLQVIGVRNKNTSKSSIYTSRTPSKEMFIREQEDVLLGFASFDISDLLRGLWEIRLNGNMIQPNNMHCININNSSDEISPFTQDILPLLDTVIKIKVRLAHDLGMIYRMVLEKVHTLNRIFLILDDHQLADSILAGVFSHNCKLFSKIHSLSEDIVLKVK